MKVRAVVLFLVLSIVFAAVGIAGGLFSVPFSGRDIFVSARDEVLSAANGNAYCDVSLYENADVRGNCTYIVKFTPDTDAEAVKKALDGREYRLLSGEADPVYSVKIEDINAFFEKYGECLEYAEQDRAVGTLSVGYPTPYNTVGIDSSATLPKASADITVAVLDTGVFREHTSLAGANILPGYDAVTGVAGVYGDSSGHGTAVIGIIAGTGADGSVSGVASGVTVLPVRVSVTDKVIYSSDLVAGIRFAADAGADIINMSIGGYSFSYAEQDAVDYANSLGCILVAAAGNGGHNEYAGQKCYPASYEGVISVASVDANGNVSEFSQYNSEVDVAAYGENIPVLTYIDGASGYGSDSGTSYSCAIVSGIAALVLSGADSGVRLEGEEFLSLIVTACGSDRNDYTGHGVIDAERVVEASKYPIVTGVYDGATYGNKVTVRFNRGTATLDGRPVSDGETVIQSGMHVLTVTDGEYVTKIEFTLNYDPLSCTYNEYTGFAVFRFTRGTATLDGYPYASGTRITDSGSHYFRLEYGNEVYEKTIALHYSVPEILGVEDGGTYSSSVNIRIVGDGSATLDGVEMNSDFTVYEQGEHTVTVTSHSGGRSKTVTFTVSDGSVLQDGDLDNAKCALDSDFGYIMLYSESLVGVRVYYLETPEAFERFLPVGNVYGHAFVGSELYLFGENGITVIDRAKAREDADCIKGVYSYAGADSYVAAGETVYCLADRDLCSVDIDGGIAKAADIPFDCNRLFTDGTLICADDGNGRFFVYDTIEKTGRTVETDAHSYGRPVCVGEGCIAVGNLIFSLDDGGFLYELPARRVLLIKENFAVTEGLVFDLGEGRIHSVFGFELSDIVFDGEYVTHYGVEGQIYTVQSSTGPFGSALRTEAFVSEASEYGAYRKDFFFAYDSEILSSDCSGSTVYFVLSGAHELYALDADSAVGYIACYLPFEPSRVFCYDDYTAVLAKNMNMVYSFSGLGEAEYFELPVKASKAVYDGKHLWYTDLYGNLFCTDRSERIASDCSDFAISSTGVIYISGGMLTLADNASGSIIASVPTNASECVVTQGYVSAGNVLYYDFDLVEAHVFPHLPMDISVSGAVCRDGMCAVGDSECGGNIGITDPDFCYFTESGSLVSVGRSHIAVSGYFDGRSVFETPEATGITDGGIYTGEAVFGLVFGSCYLDGKAVSNLYTVTESGSHILTVVLPCSRSISYGFTVAANVTGIEFVGGDGSMSIGETLRMYINYLPEGASSLPVRYICDSDGITVDEGGLVTANREGTYTVKAVCETDYGVFECECTITVRDDLIRFKSDSGCVIDRRSGTVAGLKAGLTVEELVDILVVGSGSISVHGADGSRAQTVGTGCTITLYSPTGGITDSLRVIVTGDTDGDGFLTAYDLYLLERVLKGYSYPELVTLASDIDGNGVVSDSDHYRLAGILTGRIDIPVGAPDDYGFGSAYVYTVSRPVTGQTVDIVLCLKGCKGAFGMTGALMFGEGLEFVSASDMGADIEFSKSEGRVGFCVYGDPEEYASESFCTMINLRFRITAESGTVIPLTVSDITVNMNDGAFAVDGSGYELTVSEKQYGEFSIEVLNSPSFTFDPETYNYEVLLFADSAVADIAIIYPEGGDCTFDSFAVTESDSRFHITVKYANGVTKVYNIRAIRQTGVGGDTNCLLKELEVEGGVLSPSFSPEIFEYSVSVPFGTEKLGVYCLPQSTSAKVVIGDTTLYSENQTVTITVFSEEGDRQIYKINVTLLPEKSEDPSEPEVSLSDTDGEPKGRYVWAVVIPFIALAAVAAAHFARKHKK